MADAPPPAPYSKTSVVIPAYNEEAVIDATIEALANAFDDAALAYELRVVDDGSKDSTWARLAALKERFPAVVAIKNAGPGGYGMAVRAGLETFDGDGVIVAMADGSDDSADVVAYAKALSRGADAAFGTRFSGGARVEGYPPIKRAMNRAGNGLIAMLLRQRYDDFTNGFKGYRRWVIEAMQPLIAADFNLTIEMSIKAVQAGAKYEIIPNSWRDRDGGESKFNVGRLGPRYLLTILYCLLHNHLKKAGARIRPTTNESVSASKGAGHAETADY